MQHCNNNAIVYWFTCSLVYLSFPAYTGDFKQVVKLFTNEPMNK